MDNPNKNVRDKLDLIQNIAEEIVSPDELEPLLQAQDSSILVAYDGFEPSGQIHLAQGLLKVLHVNKLIAAGFRFKMLVADWHALANNKLGGDLDKIQVTGRYFIEVWKAAGMNLDKVDFVWASDLVKDPNYWLLVLKIAKTNSINRFVRTAEIMGRSEKDDLTGAQILYPCMQVADIFTLGARVAQLGMDQRQVNMLAREIGSQLGFWKPVVVSHHMLMGLQKPAEAGSATKTERTVALKMSKSNPDSAIFVTDDHDLIVRKVNKAWCPEKVAAENPILEYYKYILFQKYTEITVARAEKWGGSLTYSNYPALEADYVQGKIHPLDIKASLVSYLDEMLQPIREHFENNSDAKSLLEKVKSFQVTR